LTRIETPPVTGEFLLLTLYANRNESLLEGVHDEEIEEAAHLD
jgi:hypothetical protein